MGDGLGRLLGRGWSGARPQRSARATVARTRPGSLRAGVPIGWPDDAILASTYPSFGRGVSPVLAASLSGQWSAASGKALRGPHCPCCRQAAVKPGRRPPEGLGLDGGVRRSFEDEQSPRTPARGSWTPPRRQRQLPSCTHGILPARVQIAPPLTRVLPRTAVVGRRRLRLHRFHRTRRGRRPVGRRRHRSDPG